MYDIKYKQMYNSAPGRYSLNERVRVPTSRGDPGLPRPPQPRAVDGRTDPPINRRFTARDRSATVRLIYPPIIPRALHLRLYILTTDTTSLYRTSRHSMLHALQLRSPGNMTTCIPEPNLT